MSDNDKSQTARIIEDSRQRVTLPLEASEMIRRHRTAAAALRIEQTLRRLLLETIAEVINAPLGATLGMNHATTHINRALQVIETSRALAAMTAAEVTP